MSAAALFPGQGEEVGRFLETWYESSVSVRELVDVAAAELGCRVGNIFARGCRALGRTRVFQPVSTALTLGVFAELIDRGLQVEVVAGHSLGELAAVAASGVMTPRTAVRLAVLRGGLMDAAAEERRGGMVALGMGPGADLDAVLSEAARYGTLVVAAYNGRRQTVLSGSWEAIGSAAAAARATPVRVSGAWHSPLMSGVVEPLRVALAAAVTGAFDRRMAFNGSGGFESDPSRVPELLSHQLVQPVRWTEVMDALRGADVREIMIPGPGRILRGLARDYFGGTVSIHVVESPEDLDLPLPAEPGIRA
jgi:[acyl-carrier-protein] S-malonyltransferase